MNVIEATVEHAETSPGVIEYRVLQPSNLPVCPYRLHHWGNLEVRDCTHKSRFCLHCHAEEIWMIGDKNGWVL